MQYWKKKVENPSETTREKAEEARNLERELMSCYKESLQEVDKDLTVKSIPMHFPDRERTMYYLYLTTHDPTGALQMNKVLWDASLEEHELRWDLLQAKKWKNQLLLFDIPAPAPATPQRATTEEIAKHILALLHGKALTRRELYKGMANEPYFPPEVDKALKALRKQERVVFEEPLKNRTLIKLR